MKMMDINGQNDGCIEAVTPAKKKKMKQAQLPFQSSTQSPSIAQNKKRKLTSPSVECRSPKAMKILKKSLTMDNVDNAKSDADIDTEDDDDCVEIMKGTEIENVKENTTSNKVATRNKFETPKRTSTGQKKLEKQEKLKSSSLTKFLQKTDKQEDKLKEESQVSIQEEEDGSTKNTPRKATNSGTSVSQTDTVSNKVEDSPSVLNDSLYQSDSDIAIVSSDNEDKDDQAKSTAGMLEDASGTPSILKTPTMEKSKQKKLTPKQQEKKLLSAKKKEERQKMKMEKEKKMEEERQTRRKEKEEKRKEKEERDKAEKEQKLMEKKLKEQKKQMEIEQKQKEKQAKEEERKKREEAKEEEKKKKEEEKLEAERKKQKAATTFTSFFVAKKQEKSAEDENMSEVKNFMPFEVKADMKIAPVCRRILNRQEKLLFDEKCNEGGMQISNLYLTEMKNKRIVLRKSSKTWPLEAKDDVILLDEENDGTSNIVNQNVNIEKQRPKLLQFSENQRPPYWGTWRKRSSSINPRRPFTRDKGWFNYEVDSDEEWEEEEPGESLHGSDDEKDEENPEDNEYDVDNDFMVPHGYLSDEELRADEEDKEDMTPETQKVKLKLLGEQFESERNAKTSKLKPKIIGCVWRGPDNEFPPNLPRKTLDFLLAHEVWIRQIPIILPSTSENETPTTSDCNISTPQQSTTSSKKSRVPEEALPDLIRLVHGNTHSRQFLVKEFMTYWSKKDKANQLSKASLQYKIREIGKWMSCPEEGPMHLKACWYVYEEVRKKYIDEELPLPNRWSYNLVPKRKSDVAQIAEKLEKEDKDNKDKKNVPLITQFTKKITQEEMKKQLTGNPTTPRSKSTKPPKRVTLISVNRGEDFTNTSKEQLKNSVSSKKVKNKKSNQNDDSDNVIVICSEDDKTDDEGKKEDKSEDQEKNEDRLGAIPMEFEAETRKEGKKSKNEKVTRMVKR